MTSDYSNLDRKLGRATHITNEEIFAERSGADMSLRKTKIVCTLGPACWDEDKLVEMINAGLDVARFNFSHGDHESHKKCLDTLRKAMAKTGKKVGLMLDTKGPEIRTGVFKEGIDSISLERGQNLRIVVDYNFKGDKDCIACSYSSLCSSVKPGNVILMADGSVSVKVESVGDGYVDTTVMNNAVIGSRKNMNLPGVKVDLPVCGEREINDIVNFGCANKMHFVAASFVQSAKDVHDIRNILGEKGRHIKIIPKIENQEGLINFDEILNACDGIMVARGDLGMEIPLEKVFLAQKMMIAKCNAAGKPVIVATQMLESMIKAPRPTRAEISDVANAVHDGADCVMLSGESANGSFPVQAVETLAKICVEAESSINYPMLYQAIHSIGPFPMQVPESVCSSAVETAEGINAKLIVALTETGQTARLIAKYKPRQVILAVSASDSSISQQSMVRGVLPVQVASFQGTDSVISKALAEGKKRGLINTGDYVVAVHGIKEEVAGSTNLMKVVICP